LCLRIVESAESDLQVLERHEDSLRFQPLFCPIDIARFEVHRQALVQPGGNAAGGKTGNHRVGELVSQNAIEPGTRAQGATYRNPDAGIEAAVRPLRRAGHVVEFLVSAARDPAGCPFAVNPVTKTMASDRTS